MISRKHVLRLIEALRRSFLYQTPQAVYDDASAMREPTHVVVRMPVACYGTVMEIINKAGGWVLPKGERLRIVAAHEARARRALGDGTHYDLMGLSQGDLLQMVKDTEGIPELAAFRSALAEEISAQRAVRDADT